MSDMAAMGHATGYGQFASTERADATSDILVLARRSTDRAASTDHTRSHCERSSDGKSDGWPLGSTSIGLGRIMHQRKASEDDAGKPTIYGEAPARRSGSHSPPSSRVYRVQRSAVNCPMTASRLWANKGEIQ